MMRLTINLKHAAIALGTGIAIGVGLFSYWSGTARNGCVRTISKTGKAAGGQEVVYVWGCLQPQRFRQWSVIATTVTQPHPQAGDRATYPTQHE